MQNFNSNPKLLCPSSKIRRIPRTVDCFSVSRKIVTETLNKYFVNLFDKVSSFLLVQSRNSGSSRRYKIIQSHKPTTWSNHIFIKIIWSINPPKYIKRKIMMRWSSCQSEMDGHGFGLGLRTRTNCGQSWTNSRLEKDDFSGINISFANKRFFYIFERDDLFGTESETIIQFLGFLARIFFSILKHHQMDHTVWYGINPWYSSCVLKSRWATSSVEFEIMCRLVQNQLLYLDWSASHLQKLLDFAFLRISTRLL